MRRASTQSYWVTLLLQSFALLSFSPNFVHGDDVAALIGHYASTIL